MEILEHTKEVGRPVHLGTQEKWQCETSIPVFGERSTGLVPRRVSPNSSRGPKPSQPISQKKRREVRWLLAQHSNARNLSTLKPEKPTGEYIGQDGSTVTERITITMQGWCKDGLPEYRGCCQPQLEPYSKRTPCEGKTTNIQHMHLVRSYHNTL